MNTHNQLSAYIEGVTGAHLDILPLSNGEDTPLPLFLRTLYEIRRADLFGRNVLLAFQKDPTEHPTPSEYAKHAARISEIMGQETILILPKLASYSRNRLVRHGVPFIVPLRQMFLPMLLIDLRERFPRGLRKEAATLTAPSQVLVLFYLLGNTVDGVALRDLAGTLGYSPMTLSNVRDELESESLCQVVKNGRSRNIRFNPNRLEVWQTVNVRLRSPVRARHWVKRSSPLAMTLASGLSALAEFSLISEDRLPTIAMRARDYRRHLETGELHGCPGAEEADAQLEAWSYDPSVLAQGATVDRLSLYLSLRDSEDARIEIALDELLAGMPW